MEILKILALQILVMFFLSGIDFLLFKTGMIVQRGSKALGNIPVYVSLPVVVFYIACLIGVLTVGQWTYGVYWLTKDKKRISFKHIVTVPALIALGLGFTVFFPGIGNYIPEFLDTILNYGIGLNTPLAMFVIGIYLTQPDLKDMVQGFSNYTVSLVRLILIPFMTFDLLSFIPNEFITLKMTALIASCCPSGANIAVLAEKYDWDLSRAVETVVISTLLSLVTIPPDHDVGWLYWGGV